MRTILPSHLRHEVSWSGAALADTGFLYLVLVLILTSGHHITHDHLQRHVTALCTHIPGELDRRLETYVKQGCVSAPWVILTL